MNLRKPRPPNSNSFSPDAERNQQQYSRCQARHHYLLWPPPLNTGTTFTVGTNFVSEPGFEGLTYSFDYGNARFVLLDQFTPPSGASHSS